MVKCTYPGCNQTAFYGRRINQPIFCKQHALTEHGSVRKKCSKENCMNTIAIGTSSDLCARCEGIYDSIAMFRDLKIAELNAQYRAENMSTVTDGSVLPNSQSSGKRAEAPAQQSCVSSTSAELKEIKPKVSKSDESTLPATGSSTTASRSSTIRSSIITSSSASASDSTALKTRTAKKSVQIPEGDSEAPESQHRKTSVQKIRAKTPARKAKMGS